MNQSLGPLTDLKLSSLQDQLNPIWMGPDLVLLTTHPSLKFQDLTPWIYHTQRKKAPEPTLNCAIDTLVSRCVRPNTALQNEPTPIMRQSSKYPAVFLMASKGYPW